MPLTLLSVSMFFFQPGVRRFETASGRKVGRALPLHPDFRRVWW